MVKVAINFFGLHAWRGGDHRAVIDRVRLADHKGIDQVSLRDHVVMGEHVSRYTFGKFSAALDFPWREPVTLLAAIAASMTNIRLSAGILISPLRPAVPLAKQLASLDVLSHGKVDIGFGMGWQKAEYDACGVPFERLADLMYEQVRLCHALWRHASARFQAKYLSFENLHSRPIQRHGIPAWVGVRPTARHFARVAELCDGCVPLGLRREQTRVRIFKLRAAFPAQGRADALGAPFHNTGVPGGWLRGH